MTNRMLYVQAITPIQVGIGQGTGVIDQPIIREEITGWPYLPGTSVKGVLRDACRREAERVAALEPDEASRTTKRDAEMQKIDQTFGPETDRASEHPGGLIIPDLKLLCLPVRTYAGGFAWVTCPLAVRRWLRDHRLAGIPLDPELPESIPLPDDAESILVTDPSDIASPGDRVYLEDLRLKRSINHGTTAVAGVIAGAVFEDSAWQEMFKSHFGIVSETTFGFLARSAMEFVTRNRIDPDRKIVADGALWMEEAVPAETIFVAPVTRSTWKGPLDLEQMLEVVTGGTAHALQIGGNATVGRGIAVATLVQGTTAPAGEEQS